MPVPGFAMGPFLVPRYRAGGQGPHLRATLVLACLIAFRNLDTPLRCLMARGAGANQNLRAGGGAYDILNTILDSLSIDYQVCLPGSFAAPLAGTRTPSHRLDDDAVTSCSSTGAP